MQIFEIKFVCSKISRIFAVLFREHSSVGLEHLPYKQRVGGSTPSAPTKSLTVYAVRLFSLIIPHRLRKIIQNLGDDIVSRVLCRLLWFFKAVM